MPTSAHSSAAATATTKRRRGKTKRCGKGARDEAIKDLVAHPNSSFVESPRRSPSQREDYEQSQRIQCFQMTNVTVSDTKISFAAGRKTASVGKKSEGDEIIVEAPMPNVQLVS
jgi:hypothetical protein